MSGGKIEVLEKEMVANNIKILGVTELWWLGQERFTTDDGSMFMYSGKDVKGNKEV